MSFLNKEVNNGKDIINVLKDDFSSTYVLNNNVQPHSYLEENNINPISKIVLNQMIVFNKSCNISTAISPDKISPIFLKECAFILIPVIIVLFNKSLDSCI